jgi:hypothetical protein
MMQVRRVVMTMVCKPNQDSWCSKGWEEQTLDSATASYCGDLLSEKRG